MSALELGPQGLASHLDWRAGLPLMVTSRVVLRELRRSDAPALLRIARSPDVARYSWPPPATVDAFERFIKWAWSERAVGKYTCFAAVPRDQNEPGGLFELRPLQPNFFRAELGLFMDPPNWDNGVFHDGARLVCEFAFKVIGVHRIEMRSPVSHTACNAALEKLGVHREGVLRSSFSHNGQFEDQYLWSLVNGLDRLNL